MNRRRSMLSGTSTLRTRTSTMCRAPTTIAGLTATRAAIGARGTTTLTLAIGTGTIIAIVTVGDRRSWPAWRRSSGRWSGQLRRERSFARPRAVEAHLVSAPDVGEGVPEVALLRPLPHRRAAPPARRSHCRRSRAGKSPVPGGGAGSVRRALGAQRLTIANPAAPTSSDGIRHPPAHHRLGVAEKADCLYRVYVLRTVALR
jgi:hypothetical protein